MSCHSLDMHRPSVPDKNNVRTYYARPWLDRLTGRYTVEWENAEGLQRIRVHNRFFDLEGNRPSLGSVLRLPKVFLSYLATRQRPILPNPVPFLVWDAIHFLERELRPGARVLEVGSGNSTLWFLHQGAYVTSLEHSADWARSVLEFAREDLGEAYFRRLDYHVVEGQGALRRIAELPNEFFDVALIDSMNAYTYRPAALAAARSKVRKGGWMVLDNADHPNNWPALELMEDRERVRFTGYAPMGSVVSQTSAWRM